MSTKKESQRKTKYNKTNSIILNSSILILGIIIVFLCFFLFFLPSDTVEEKDTFTLIGGDITLAYKQPYKEPGYIYIDKNKNDLTSQVVVTNNVNSDIPGKYHVYYKYGELSLTRKVVVSEPSSYNVTIDYEIKNKQITKDNVTINYSIYGDTFTKLVLPNGETSYELDGSFVVENNGTYKITAYNDQDMTFEQKIVIDNIDKEDPVGTCKATLNLKNTNITVDATDNYQIDQYEYLDNNNLIDTLEQNEYTTKGKTTEKISVKVYDEVGNNTMITCSIIDNRYYEPIKPPSGENVIFKEETETLKAYISKINNYYLTRIWVRDGYSQLNKAVSPQYGEQLYLPIKLLDAELSNKKLQNKLIIGFNASGFYLKNTFDAYSVSKYPPYNRTSVGTIVINNGKVVRNAYDKAVKQWYLTGINKENKMVVFEDNVANGTDAINKKKAWSQTVINSGIRNTLSFAGPVILNGIKLTSFSSSMPNSANNAYKGLQLICQIDENNYALFTASSERRNVAIDKFLEIGCTTAVNLDGGGSVTLYYKSKNSTGFTRILGGIRALPETAYFTE